VSTRAKRFRAREGNCDFFMSDSFPIDAPSKRDEEGKIRLLLTSDDYDHEVDVDLDFDTTEEEKNCNEKFIDFLMQVYRYSTSLNISLMISLDLFISLLALGLLEDI
jgi:hypothetical protein